MIDILTSDTFLTLVAINVIAAIGMNLVYITGQLNLGQAAFLAIGAYTTSFVDIELGWPLALSLVAAAAMAALVALPVAIGANRVRGIYLIMGTLAVGELVRVAIGNIDRVGGLQGYFGMEAVSSFEVFATLGVVIVLAVALVTTPHGLRMRAIFDDEDAAAAAGVATRRVKISAVMASAAVVAVSGGLLAKWLLFIAPREFGIDVSFQIALYTLIGGVHSLMGALAGAVSISVLLEVLNRIPQVDYIPSMFHFLSGWRLVVFGALVIIVMPLLPEGLVSRRTALRLTRPFRTLGRNLTGWPAKARTATLVPSDASPGEVLRLEAITHDFGGVRALNEVDLAVGSSEIVALIGANGAGKTTLIDVAGGRLRCQSGRIIIGSADVTRERAEARTRNGVGRTFQSVRVFAHLTVEETVQLGSLAGRGRGRGPTVAEILELTDLRDRRDVMPEQLTLGERRRLEVGRAVASHPSVVFLDEPSVGMNDDERNELAELVLAIRGLGISVVLVDHNLDLALGVADRVVVLDFGEVIATGTASEILDDPRVRAAYLGQGDGEAPLGEVDR